MTERTLAVIPVPGEGAEDVLVADDGTVYTGTADGSIFAIRPDDDQVAHVGRPFGRTPLADRVEAGTTDHLVSDLLGYPDNIARGSDGLIWVTIASPKDPVLELLHRSPMWLRKGALRVPESVQPAPKRTVRVQAFDDSGDVAQYCTLPADSSHMATGVRERADRVWLGSLQEPAVAWFDL